MRWLVHCGSLPVHGLWERPAAVRLSGAACLQVSSFIISGAYQPLVVATSVYDRHAVQRLTALFTRGIGHGRIEQRPLLAGMRCMLCGMTGALHMAYSIMLVCRSAVLILLCG